jgi:hypothetical protein
MRSPIATEPNHSIAPTFRLARIAPDGPGASLPQRLRHFNYLFRPCTDPVVLRQVHPPYSSSRIDQKLRRSCDVLSVDSLPCVDQVVAANRFGFRIR